MRAISGRDVHAVSSFFLRVHTANRIVQEQRTRLMEATAGKWQGNIVLVSDRLGVLSMLR